MIGLALCGVVDWEEIDRVELEKTACNTLWHTDGVIHICTELPHEGARCICDCGEMG